MNVLAATLALSAIAFYVFVYTMWLKRTTTQNIVIGGAAGAVPALVGWAAVTGTLAAPAWILFAIIFVWTPPHFWALAMRFQGDYAAAGVPMLPGREGRGRDPPADLPVLARAVRHDAAAVPRRDTWARSTCRTAIVLGGVFVYRALRLWREPDPDRAWGLFKYSIVYLAALFGAVAAGRALAVWATSRRSGGLRQHLVDEPAQLRARRSARTPTIGSCPARSIT